MEGFGFESRGGKKERSFSPFADSSFRFSLSHPFLFRYATSAWKARALRDDTNQCGCVGDNLCSFDCIVY